MIREYNCIDCGTECEQRTAGRYKLRCEACHKIKEHEWRRMYLSKKELKTIKRKPKTIKLKNGMTVLNNCLGQTMQKQDNTYGRRNNEKYNF